MRRILGLAVLGFQVGITAGALLLIYLVYAVLTNEDANVVSMVGFFLFQPLYAVLLTAITLLICLVIGLPLRLHASLNNWWRSKPFIPFLGVGMGLLLLALAFYPPFKEVTPAMDDVGIEYPQPNTACAATGWFLTAFCLLHFYPQAILIYLRQKVLRRFLD